MKPLVVGLGNDLLSDDAIGVLTARELHKEIGDQADVIESNLTGVALIDLFIGYKQVIIIDAIYTSRFKPGTIIELDPKDLSAIPNPSPHYTGLPEMIKIADQLNLEFPKEIKIFTIEVVDPHTIGGKLSEPVASAMGKLVSRVKEYLQYWKKEVINA